MPNKKCQLLLQEGLSLLQEQRLQEALPKLLAAREADPEAPEPLGFLGDFWMRASRVTEPQYVQEYRARAENYARASLSLDDTHPIGLAVLSGLLSQEPPAHQPKPTAKELTAQGELFFIRDQFKDALRLYLAAAQEDPNYTEALKYAGDCYFSMANYQEAEALYRRAVTIAPLDAQGWRFLASVLGRQQKLQEQLLALYASVSANPAYYPAWGVLSAIFRARQKPLISCHIKPQASVGWDEAEQKPSISISQSESAVQAAAWLCYAVSKANQMNAQVSPFETEREALRTAGRFVQEKVAQEPEARATFGAPLLALARLAEKDLMNEATFLLCYRESFRSEFERWKEENPGRIMYFIETECLRPY